MTLYWNRKLQTDSRDLPFKKGKARDFLEIPINSRQGLSGNRISNMSEIHIRKHVSGSAKNLVDSK